MFYPLPIYPYNMKCTANLNGNINAHALQRLLAARLDGEKTHGHEGREDQSARGVDRGGGVGAAGIDRDQGGTETRDTVQAAGDSGAGAAVRGREDLGRIGVQDAVHDILEESLEAGADEDNVGVSGCGEAEEQDSRDHGGDGHGALAADVFDFDRVAGQNGARETDDGGNCVVAVGDVG